MSFAFLPRNPLKTSLYGSAIAIAVASGAIAEQSPTDVMVVFDASGSMWGQVDGTTKIEIARDVFTGLSQDWAQANQPVGLIAYGHRRKGDCGDIELIARPSVEAAGAMASTVQNLTPRGKTPLSQAVRLAAEELKFTENAATVVLLSDGIETCDLDPCAVGADLERLGVDFTAHVIGFDIQDPLAKQQLACLAENTGGTYRDASDARSLGDALADVTTAQAAPVAAPKTAPVHISLTYADNTSRPAEVTYTARNLETGEIIQIAQLNDTAQIVAGPKAELPVGTWVISAEGDGGKGELQITLPTDEDTIWLPFAAGTGGFTITGPSTFAADDMVTVTIGVTTPPQQNATFEVALVPEGATNYSQALTYSYLFGSDTYPVEYQFYLEGLGALPGTYDVMLVQDGNETVETPIARKTIQIVDPTEMAGANMADITVTAQYADGTLPQGMAHWSFILPGAQDAMAPSTPSSKAMFEDMELGLYEVQVTVETPDGETSAATQLLLEADGPTDFVIDLPRPELNFRMDQLRDPLTAGAQNAILLSGPLGNGAQATFIGLAGQQTVMVPINGYGTVSIPDQIEPGPYRLHVLRGGGDDTFVDIIDILPSEQDMGGEDPSTMISPEEIAAETGPNDLYFEPWQTCESDEPCRIQDKRVDLVWTLPPNWATSEPFYYTTAGGSQAENPTVDMAPLSGGAFTVVLNPRQWDAQIGPCEEVTKGTLCREASEVARDLEGYEQIKSSLMGDTMHPEGWLPLGRSWTIKDDIAGGMIALLRFDEPAENADTITGEIAFTKPGDFGLTSSSPIPVELSLLWSGAPVVYDIGGFFEIDGKRMRINLRRPGDWDGKANAWRGELGEADAFLETRIYVF